MIDDLQTWSLTPLSSSASLCDAWRVRGLRLKNCSPRVQAELGARLAADTSQRLEAELEVARRDAAAARAESAQLRSDLAVKDQARGGAELFVLKARWLASELSGTLSS